MLQMKERLRLPMAKECLIKRNGSFYHKIKGIEEIPRQFVKICSQAAKYHAGAFYIRYRSRIRFFKIQNQKLRLCRCGFRTRFIRLSELYRQNTDRALNFHQILSERTKGIRQSGVDPFWRFFLLSSFQRKK